MKKFAVLTFATLLVAALPGLAPAPMYAQIAPFPLTETGLAISRPTQSNNPFTVAGPTGVVLGTQDGQFESWILPVKLLSHLTIEANIEGYTVPIDVNAQAANIEVRPDHTTITYSHIAFTLRQIMFSPDAGVPQVSNLRPGSDANQTPLTGPVVLFQIDCDHPMDLIFRFTPELRWMWPKRNDGIPGPDWIEYRAPAAKGTPAATDLTGTPQLPPLEPGLAADKSPRPGFYALHMDYPDLAGAVTIPTATPGVLAPYQERPQVHPLELRLHYDPKRDGQGAQAKYFPLLMAIGTSPRCRLRQDAVRNDDDRDSRQGAQRGFSMGSGLDRTAQGARANFFGRGSDIEAGRSVSRGVLPVRRQRTARLWVVLWARRALYALRRERLRRLCAYARGAGVPDYEAAGGREDHA